MHEISCVEFLQSTLPQMRMRWPGFRRVRRHVCRRVTARIRELDLGGLAAYREYLAGNAGEWEVLDRMCRITISRFFRDRQVFHPLAAQVLPALIRQAEERGEKTIRCWSAGCASGEEPYTLALIWELLVPGAGRFALKILASDSDPTMLARARTACYGRGSVKELPEPLLARGFARKGKHYFLKPEFRARVEFICQDIREELPPGPFHLILCRNLVFTYFSEELQGEMLARLHSRLLPGGALVIGIHESLPATGLFAPWPQGVKIFQKC
jgi:chemotaxis protein methyltransferase CheR